mgnify:FL=1
MYEYRIYVNSGSLWIQELCLVESGINVRAFHLLPAPFLYIPDQALHASSFVFIKRFVMSLLIGIFYDTKYTGRM